MDFPGGSCGQNLQRLSALLSAPSDEDDDEDATQKRWSISQLGPGHIGPPAPKHQEVKSGDVKRSSKDIWSEEEVAESGHLEDLTDPRPQPEYEIILKQNVGTEDLFLGLSGKDPSSMSCEAMMVKIKLPDTKVTDVVLDVKEKFLDLRTPKHKLGLHLPHVVYRGEGTAQFFSERQELQVTLLLRPSPMDLIMKP